jgi:hypothetical protein
MPYYYESLMILILITSFPLKYCVVVEQYFFKSVQTLEHGGLCQPPAGQMCNQQGGSAPIGGFNPQGPPATRTLQISNLLVVELTLLGAHHGIALPPMFSS